MRPLPRSAGVRPEVHDPDPYRMPALRAPLPDGTGGRGLQLVDAVTRHMAGACSLFAGHAGRHSREWDA